MQNETSAPHEPAFVPKQVAQQVEVTEIAVGASSPTLPAGRRMIMRVSKEAAYHSAVVSSHRATWPQKVLQNWEGTVVGVTDSSFQANMLSTLKPGPLDYFDIDLDNVADGDIGLVREGAKFYLTVLSIIPPGESAQKTTRVVFRRLPKMRPEAIAEAEEEATELWDLLRPGYEAQASSTGEGQS